MTSAAVVIGALRINFAILPVFNVRNVIILALIGGGGGQGALQSVYDQQKVCPRLPPDPMF